DLGQVAKRDVERRDGVLHVVGVGISARGHRIHAVVDLVIVGVAVARPGSQVSSTGACTASKPAFLSCWVSGARTGWMKAGVRTLTVSTVPSLAHMPL